MDLLDYDILNFFSNFAQKPFLWKIIFRIWAQSDMPLFDK